MPLRTQHSQHELNVCLLRMCSGRGKPATRARGADMKAGAVAAYLLSCLLVYPARAEYRLQGLVETPDGFQGRLVLAKEELPEFGASLPELKLNVWFESDERVRIKITDPQDSRWEIPEDILPLPGVGRVSSPRYALRFSDADQPFGLRVDSQGVNGAVAAWDSMDMPLVFKDQYIQVTSRLPAGSLLYGLGESTRSSLPLREGDGSGGVYSLWNRDLPAATFDANTYGSHPFYLQVRPPLPSMDGRNGSTGGRAVASGVFLRNSHGMDVLYQRSNITFKMIGGVVDLFVLLGPSPSEVLTQYSHVIGTPALMPYWSLGFHNCRWGYDSVGELEEVVANYSAAQIPLEAAWADIDYMDGYKDFTVDPRRFPLDRFSSFLSSLHAKDQRMVLIVDPAIAVNATYAPYTEGLKEGVFLKGIDGQPYIGAVWPGATVFPDFLHNKSLEYWTTQLKGFHDTMPIDGAWIDMNEPSNFCNPDGKTQVCRPAASAQDCPGAPCASCCSLVDADNKWDFPPYALHNADPHNAGSFQLLGANTVPMSATHQDGTPFYHTHNLYGLLEARATAAAMSRLRQSRPFVLSRSTFAGSGRYAAHWTGDNAATWADLRASVVSVVRLSMLHLPMVGADICGFFGDSNEELCLRWIQLGAFYPFSRTHNIKDALPQEPYRWASVAASARTVLSVRYALLPYLYTLLWRAHVDGSTVARPLFLNFPHDPAAYQADGQFMLGPGLLLTPVLTQGATSVLGYFPQGQWTSFFDFDKSLDSTQGLWTELPTPLNATQLHVRHGVIVPMQVPGLTTTASRRNPFHLLIPLAQIQPSPDPVSPKVAEKKRGRPGPEGGGGLRRRSREQEEEEESREAHGELFLDDGEQRELDRYTHLSFAARASGVRARIDRRPAENTDAAALWIEKLVVLNLPPDVRITTVRANGERVDRSQWTLEARGTRLIVTGLKLALDRGFEVTWGAE